ncbi:MAG: hypothetical protein IKN29_06585 [Bacteroidales bacterium]|nr:hypothetical protein [Bacteroidales bacterium]
MKTKILFVFLFLFPMVSFGQQADTTTVVDTVPQIYIPTDLPDCIRQLDSMLSAEDKAYIRTEGAAAVHFSLGMWMRNNWGLWRGSQLQTYFIDNGIQHPDNMSGVILDCYVKHLRGEEVNYKRMLRDARRAEEEWLKKIKKQEKEEQKEEQLRWEYQDRYKCEFDYDTIPFDSSTAFLHLPLTVDSLAGIQVRYRQRGEPLEEELERVRRTLNRPPRWTPRTDELVNPLHNPYKQMLQDRVKHLEEDVDSEGRHVHYEYDFNPDGTLARKTDDWQRRDDTKKSYRSEYTYADGRLTECRDYTDDTLKKVTQYVYTEEYMIACTGNDSVRYLLSPEGLPLQIYHPNGYSDIFEYDALGRKVNHLEYRNDSLRWWKSYVYDDSLRVVYEIGNHYLDESTVECHVMNERGDEVGECCPHLLPTFNYKKTLYSYRYDRRGNWEKRYFLGELKARRKIKYY